MVSREYLPEIHFVRALIGAADIDGAMGRFEAACIERNVFPRALLERLLKLSEHQFVPPYHIALLYNALGDREQTYAWLERAFEVKDPKLTFLKVDPKWNNLRSGPKFQELLKRAGF